MKLLPHCFCLLALNFALWVTGCAGPAATLPQAANTPDAVAASDDEEFTGCPDDIVNLLRAGKIEIKTEGNGIRSLTLGIRRKSAAPVTVKIPVGTFFISSNPGSQNMVATKASGTTLTDDEWETMDVSVACANMPRAIPGSTDRFSVRHAPNQAALAQLMPFLDRAGASDNTRQAAVWITTDNASYEGLGTLVASRNGVPLGRVIKEPEAAKAMKIYDDAGLDIRQKAIWHDRQRILQGLSQGELRQWLLKKDQGG